jgi:hypothetical protein
MQEKFMRIFEYELSNIEIETMFHAEEYEEIFHKLMDIAQDYAIGNKRFKDLLETWGETDGWLSHIPEIVGILNTLNLLD